MKQHLCTVAASLILIAVCNPALKAQSDATKIYKANCVLCHSTDGSGDSPSGKALKAKDLRSEETQKKSDGELNDVVTKGRGKMPAFGQKLTTDQIQQLVAHIRQLGKK